MTNTNIMRLLGLTAILCTVFAASSAYALGTPGTPIPSDTLVNSVENTSAITVDVDVSDIGFVGTDSIYLNVTGSTTTTLGPILVSDAIANIVTFTIPGSTLNEGTNTLVATAVDGVNPNLVSTSADIVVDLTAPLFPNTPNLQAASDSSINTDNITNDNTPSFDISGVVSGDTVRLYANGIEVASGVATGASITLTSSVLLDVVDTSMTATSTDPAGNVSAISGFLLVTIDTTNPVVTGSVLNINATGTTIKTLVNQYTESCSATDITPASPACAKQSGGIDTAGPLNVLQTIVYEATDTAGNVGTDTITTTVIAGNSPVITILGDNPKTIAKNAVYSDAGATASDVEDGDLTLSIATSGSVDTSTIGDYVISYDVTDSSGNPTHAERTVQVRAGDSPVITILGDNPVQLDYGVPYVDLGAFANDTEDDATSTPLTVIPSGTAIDTTVGGYGATSYIVSYDVTDSSGNPTHAERIVNVGGRIIHGDYCTGDCIPPTIGLDSSGRRMVDWPVIYHTSTVDFRQLAEYFHTPMNDFTVNVGDINTLQFVVYDNSGFDAIRQIGLSIGVPFSGTFNDGAAQLRWFAAPLGQTVGDNTSYMEETDKNNIFELKSFDTERVECDPHTTGNNNCMGVTVKYIFREAPKDTAVRLDIWDEKRNAFQHVLNEGVTVKGDSMNGPDVFTAMANNGYMYTLTTDNNFATDQNGDRWSLVDGFWAKDLKPVINSLDDAREMAKDQQEAIAKQTFDGSKLQKTITPVKDFIPEHYDRLHDPVPNMIKAYIDYAKKQAGHS